METGSISQKEKIAVACVLWQGHFRGRNYHPEWANRLKCMVDRHLSTAYDFYCFTNAENYSHFRADVTPIPLQKDWPGWWAKMELFSSFIPDRYDAVLVLDLDVILLRSLDECFDYARNSIMCFAPQTEMSLGPMDREGKRRVQRFRTGAFIFRPREMWQAGLISQFMRNAKRAIKKYRGDQDWWGDHFPRGSTFPKEWFTKTKHIRNGMLPERPVKIVFCNPIKNEAAVKKWDWAKRIWSC